MWKRTHKISHKVVEEITQRSFKIKQKYGEEKIRERSYIMEVASQLELLLYVELLFPSI